MYLLKTVIQLNPHLPWSYWFWVEFTLHQIKPVSHNFCCPFPSLVPRCFASGLDAMFRGSWPNGSLFSSSWHFLALFTFKDITQRFRPLTRSRTRQHFPHCFTELSGPTGLPQATENAGFCGLLHRRRLRWRDPGQARATAVPAPLYRSSPQDTASATETERGPFCQGPFCRADPC